MISGEPRTASIVARGECLVWCINRATFEQRVAAVDSRVAEGAHAIIRDLRKTNIRSVYKNLLCHSFLSSFPILHGVSSDTTQSLIGHMAPRVCRSGEVLCDPSVLHQNTTFYFVLRGKLRVKLPQGRSALPHGVSMQEILGRVLDVPRPKRSALAGSSSQQQLPVALQQMAASWEMRHNDRHHTAVPSSSSSGQTSLKRHQSIAAAGQEFVGDISGPVLLNLAGMFLRHSTPPPPP